jgi:Zn-dependent protease with chaperone function
LSERQNLEKIMSTATANQNVQRIIDYYTRRDNYTYHLVGGCSFSQVGSAFTIGGKIPIVSVPIGIIYVQDSFVSHLPSGELEFVVLHELGHLVNNHIVWNMGLLLVKEKIVEGLRDLLRDLSLRVSTDDVRNFIGLVKSFLARKTIEEQITAQAELMADAYAVRLQSDKSHGISFLQRLGSENLDSPTHITQDGTFFNTAITVRERIDAIERL